MKHNLVNTTIANDQLIEIIKTYYLKNFKEEVKVEFAEELIEEKYASHATTSCKISKQKQEKNIVLTEELNEKDIKEILEWYIEDCKIKNVTYNYQEERIGIMQHLLNVNITLKEKPKKRTRTK